MDKLVENCGKKILISNIVRDKNGYTYLEFEKPISELENKIESLRDNKDNDESVHQEISSLSDKIENSQRNIRRSFHLAKVK